MHASSPRLPGNASVRGSSPLAPGGGHCRQAWRRACRRVPDSGAPAAPEARGRHGPAGAQARAAAWPSPSLPPTTLLTKAKKQNKP